VRALQKPQPFTVTTSFLREVGIFEPAEGWAAIDPQKRESLWQIAISFVSQLLMAHAGVPGVLKV